MLVAGGAGGAFETGRHIEVSDDRPIADLGLTFLQAMGIDETQFGEDGESPVAEILA